MSKNNQNNLLSLENMNEKKKTFVYGGVALALMFLAWITQPSPVTPDDFTDQGELFFPDFEDPNSATSLEVIDYDAASGTAIPFKVVNVNGNWSIPSHHDYPADGKDRLAKTAAGVIGIRKDDFRTKNAADHAACGVIDPLDESSTATEGRGKRVTIRGENDLVLADFIIGNEVEGGEGYRFVRVPDQKHVYAVKTDVDISTNFTDWIEKDLLLVEKSKINQVLLKDYSINERRGTINQRDELTLTKTGTEWKLDRLPRGRQIDKTKIDELLKNIDELNIVGIRPKPSGLSGSLTRDDGGIEITQGDYLDLQGKGFYFVQDGSLVSNEGEIQVFTNEGIVYTLRFGEVADADAGAAASGEATTNRYLFITSYFERETYPEPRQPQNTDFLGKADSTWTDADRTNKSLHDAYQNWQTKFQAGVARETELKNRFAPWYYVISNESFEKMKLTRQGMTKAIDG